MPLDITEVNLFELDVPYELQLHAIYLSAAWQELLDIAAMAIQQLPMLRHYKMYAKVTGEYEEYVGHLLFTVWLGDGEARGRTQAH